MHNPDIAQKVAYSNLFEVLTLHKNKMTEQIKNNQELASKISKVLQYDGYVMCEVFVTTTQKFEPKSATKKLDDGTLISPPLEDMAPFLSREELAENMYIPMLPEE